MTRSLLSLLAAGLVLGACGDDDADPANPRKLWLALMGSERAVQLVPDEPDPF